MPLKQKIPKLLVVDANILFSFFSADSTRRHLMNEFLSKNGILVSPAFVFEELQKDKEKIKKFCRVNEEEFSALYSFLRILVDTVPKEQYKALLSKARELFPHGKKNCKDNPYFALALSLNAPIWSDEKAFKKQLIVKVYNTKQLCKLLFSNKNN